MLPVNGTSKKEHPYIYKYIFNTHWPTWE